jgi:hypothetical protein
VRDDDENVGTAVELAMKAVQTASVDGRALYAANLALRWPAEPVAALWHATTLLREHRGDGHVAVLAAAGISGRESNVLHAAAGAVPADYIKRTRHYDDAEWRTCEQSLADRGLLTSDGSLSAAGTQLKQHVEDTTDALSLRAFNGLDDDEITALLDALAPIARLVIAGGDIPTTTPMSLRRDF